MNALGFRDNDGGNYTFVDGHAKWYMPRQIKGMQGKDSDMWGHYDSPPG